MAKTASGKASFFGGSDLYSYPKVVYVVITTSTDAKLNVTNNTFKVTLFPLTL
jgi:hypothetical protein